MTVTALGYRFLRFYLSVFALVLVFTEKIYKTLNTVFEHISKLLEIIKCILRYAFYFQLFSQCLEMWLNTVFRV